MTPRSRDARSPAACPTCVEWAPYAQAHEAGIPVRDSKQPTGPVLVLSPEAWTGLVEFAKRAEM
nr:DUF397 domain-containing protein [Streptomyces sp. NBC_00857]